MMNFHYIGEKKIISYFFFENVSDEKMFFTIGKEELKYKVKEQFLTSKIIYNFQSKNTAIDMEDGVYISNTL